MTIPLSALRVLQSMGYPLEEALIIVEALEKAIPPLLTVDRSVDKPSTKASQRTARWRAKKRRQASQNVDKNVDKTVDTGGTIGGEVLSFEEEKKKKEGRQSGEASTVTPVFPDPEDMELALDAYNQVAQSCGLPKVLKLTDTRKKKLRRRLKDAGSLDAFYDACRALQRAKFCHGNNDRGWRADFDFLLQEQSFNRLLEGFYDQEKVYRC